jgi:hypothetical protein
MTNLQNGTADQNSNSWQNDFLRTKLHNAVLNVRFVKKDGTERCMRCTLQEQYLPEINIEQKITKTNEQSIAVWDLDKNAWRSFRWDSIIGYTEEQ